MNKVIVYKEKDNSLSYCYPADNCGLTVEQIADKDVPENLPYKIIEESELSAQDPIFFGAYEIEFTKPDGIGMGHEKWFAKYISVENYLVKK